MNVNEIPLAAPVDAVRYVMNKRNLDTVELRQYLGSRSRVSEFMAGKQRLSLAQIIKLHEGLGIPYECLIDKRQYIKEKNSPA